MSGKTIAAAAALVTALALTGCAASTATGAPTDASSPLASANTAPTTIAQPAAPTLTAASTAQEIGAALGCTGWVPKKPAKSSFGPADVSEGSCQLNGKWYSVYQYKTAGDLMAVLLMTKGLVAGVIHKPWTFGVGDNWLVSAGKDGDGSMASIGADMTAAVQAVGGGTKTVNPSSTL